MHGQSLQVPPPQPGKKSPPAPEGAPPGERTGGTTARVFIEMASQISPKFPIPGGVLRLPQIRELVDCKLHRCVAPAKYTRMESVSPCCNLTF